VIIKWNNSEISYSIKMIERNYYVLTRKQFKRIFRFLIYCKNLKMTTKWEQNREVLFSIVKEQLAETKLSNDIKSNVMNFTQHTISEFYNKRYSYSSVVSLNKAILENISNYILSCNQNTSISINDSLEHHLNSYSSIQSVPLDQFKPTDNKSMKIENATIQKLHQDRMNTFSKSVETRQKEFQSSINVKHPQEVDFKDPDQDDEPFDIDRLLEMEIQKRQLDIVPQDVKNEVNEFIHKDKSTEYEKPTVVFSNKTVDINTSENKTSFQSITNRLKKIPENIKNIENNENINININDETNISKPLKSILKRPYTYSSSYLFPDEIVISEINLNQDLQNPNVVYNQTYNVELHSDILSFHKSIIIEEIFIQHKDIDRMADFILILSIDRNSKSNVERNPERRLFTPSIQKKNAYIGEYYLDIVKGTPYTSFSLHIVNPVSIQIERLFLKYKTV
jgi:hypothetical protein